LSDINSKTSLAAVKPQPETPFSNRAADLVVLASGNGSNLQAIIDACREGRLPARVEAIFSDQPGAYALERGRLAGLPAIPFPWTPYRQAGKKRQDYDKDLAEQVSQYSPDLVILAGWMRLLTSSFLDCFPMRVVNLHPALPGHFPGTHAIERAWRAFQEGEIQHTGVMVHLVPDEGVDNGPLVASEAVPIYMTDTLEKLEERIHAVEHRLLVSAIHSLIEDNELLFRPT
jgi:phosphoribosylglycinamide formyltransferase 1